MPNKKVQIKTMKPMPPNSGLDTSLRIKPVRHNFVSLESAPSLSLLLPAPMNFLKQNSRCVLGGTVWAMRKLLLATPDRLEKLPQFDLVVIDEASQLLLSQACFPLIHLHPKSGPPHLDSISTPVAPDPSPGRLLLAGDHHQLSPILTLTILPLRHMNLS